MNIPIRQTHAAICFIIVSLYTLFGGLGYIALCVGLHRADFYPLAMMALAGLVSCALSAMCAWAAWSLFKRKPRAGLIAIIAWLLVGVLTLWCLFSVASSGWDLVGIIIVAVLAVLELLIGIYLLERRHETAV
jgi:hypothetical protein